MTAPAAVGRPSFSDLEPGIALFEHVRPVTRWDVVRYAAASGDLNTIHWDERTARAAGLPDVVAHGMFTMGVAATALTRWAGAGSVLSYQARFARPALVPREMGTRIVVTALLAAKLDAPTVRVALDVRCDGESVLSRAVAVVRLDP